MRILRDRVGKSGWIHWLLQQPDFRTHVIHFADCGAVDGCAGRLRHLGSGRRSRGSGGSLRFVSGGWRAVAGLQSGVHSRRHSAENSNSGADRGRGGKPCDVFSPDAAARRQHQSRRRGIWRRRSGRWLSDILHLGRLRTFRTRDQTQTERQQPFHILIRHHSTHHLRFNYNTRRDLEGALSLSAACGLLQPLSLSPELTRRINFLHLRSSGRRELSEIPRTAGHESNHASIARTSHTQPNEPHRRPVLLY